MPSITIRNLDKTLLAKLRKRAVGHGRSMEEEARVVLEMSLAPKKRHSMADAFREWFGPRHGVDLELPERQLIDEPPQFR